MEKLYLVKENKSFLNSKNERIEYVQVSLCADMGVAKFYYPIKFQTEIKEYLADVIEKLPFVEKK